MLHHHHLRFGSGQIILTPLTISFKIFVLATALPIIWLSKPENFSIHTSEYYALILLSALGMGFLITTENILMLFVSLELFSLSLYGLTAFYKTHLSSAEAALKYFAFGGVSSAFLLFGLSYLFGSTNSLSLHELKNNYALLAHPSSLLLTAFFLILVGLGFKIAAAPFHFWAPDVYEGAPTMVAAWIATGSKIASFFILIKILQLAIPYGALRLDWTSALTFLSALSLIVGNLGALRQTKLKRLLAYSSIGHTGYFLVGLAAMTREGMAAALFYLVPYALANLGIFSIVGIAIHRLKFEGNIKEFAGFWRRSPFLSFLTMLLMLSLAGLPPLGGFIGKYYLFLAAIQSQPQFILMNGNLYPLVALALAMSAVSLYYYLKIIKTFLVLEPAEKSTALKINFLEGLSLLVIAILVVALGIFPQPLIHFMNDSLPK